MSDVSIINNGIGAGIRPIRSVVGGSSNLQSVSVKSSGGSGGSQYTSSMPVGTTGIFSGAVKESLRKFLERRDQKILDLALAPGDDNVAQLCWGGINKNNPRVPFRTTVTNRKAKEDPPNKPDENKKYNWREQERFVVKTKITNPEDKEQYIWVMNCKAMVVTAPSQEPFNGKIHVFEFNGKETCIGVDEGK